MTHTLRLVQWMGHMVSESALLQDPLGVSFSKRRKAEFMVGIGPRMGPPQAERETDQLHLWVVSGRLHVLADPQTPFRLVPRTNL